MSRWPDFAARAALRSYRKVPLGDRVHVWMRWLSCPFPPIVEALPTSGRVLEIGCGHGLFSSYLVRQSPALQVLGVDIDVTKIVVANAVEKPGERRLDFEVSEPGAIPAGPWNGIVLVDVLYLLDEPSQQSLLESCVSALAPGGTLVIKDMATRPRWKARWNALQETLSVRLLKITAGSPDFAFVDEEARARWLAAAGLVDVRGRRIDRGRVHPHHLLTGRAAS